MTTIKKRSHLISDRAQERGVALLVVLMLVLGLLILGQAAMLLMDQVALRSGTYRRWEIGAYCAEEGLNLGRAWVLQNMGTGSQLDPRILNDSSGNPQTPPGITNQTGFFADITDGSATGSLYARNICKFATIAAFPPTGKPVTGLANLCRVDEITGQPMYRINLVDDMDEPIKGGVINPFHDNNSVFIIRSECLAGESSVTNGQGLQLQDVAMVEVNQAGAAACYGNSAAPAGASSNGAGCGGGYGS